MHEILKHAAERAEHAEVYHLRRTRVPVQFDAQGLSVIKTKRSEGAALRTICEGRLGYATSTDLLHPEEVVEAAVSTAAFGDEAELEFPSTNPEVTIDLFDRSIEEVPAEKLADLGESIRRSLLQHEAEIEVDVTLETIVDHVHVVNTAGLDVEEKTAALNVSFDATRARADDIYTMADSCLLRSMSEFDADRITRRVRWLLDVGRDVVAAPSGSLPVVFSPAGVVAVFLPVMIGLSGKSALLGTSPLAGKVGQPIFDERVNLSDDGRCESGARASSFDDEGVPSERTALVGDGVLQGFYYDLRTARQAKTRSTGNGLKGGYIGGRDFRPAPSPGIRHLIVGEGDVPTDELIGGIARGLLVDSVLGLGQGNVHAGDFSNNVAVAFMIENGKIVGRVKNAMISGNSYELLKNHIIGLSTEREWLYGRFLSPSVALSDVNVAAS
jgi:PmbA protein